MLITQWVEWGGPISSPPLPTPVDPTSHMSYCCHQVWKITMTVTRSCWAAMQIPQRNNEINVSLFLFTLVLRHCQNGVYFKRAFLVLQSAQCHAHLLIDLNLKYYLNEYIYIYMCVCVCVCVFLRVFSRLYFD